MSKLSCPARRDRLRCRGGVPVRILLASVTLVVVGAAIVVMLNAYQNRQKVYLRKAMELSEEGLMLALEHLRTEPSWREGTPRTEYRGGWYQVQFKEGRRGDTLLLTAECSGGSGPVVRKKSVTLKLMVQDGDSLWVPSGMTMK